MEPLRALLKRLAPRPAEPTPSPRATSSSSSSEGRQSRADHVNEMREEVSRLQQEILAHSHSSRDVGASAFDAKMSGLERQLDTAQKELAKLQGRV